LSVKKYYKELIFKTKGEIKMLELFVLETCPYCIKVMDFLNNKHIKYRKIDITNKESEDSLIKIEELKKEFSFDQTLYNLLKDKITDTEV
jgi:glutaredoxin